MSSNPSIPDGSKFTSPQGTRAVKGGQKPNAHSHEPDVSRKPPWLRVKLPSGAHYDLTMELREQALRLGTLAISRHADRELVRRVIRNARAQATPT